MTGLLPRLLHGTLDSFHGTPLWPCIRELYDHGIDSEFRNYYTRISENRFIGHPLHCIIALKETPIAICMFRPLEFGVYVVPERRHRGLGTLLYQEAKKHPVYRVDRFSFSRHDPVSRAFYAAMERRQSYATNTL